MAEMNEETFPRLVRTYRLEADERREEAEREKEGKLTPDKLAEKVGLAPNTIKNYENPAYVSAPDIDNILRLAAYFESTLQWEKNDPKKAEFIEAGDIRRRWAQGQRSTRKVNEGDKPASNIAEPSGDDGLPAAMDGHVDGSPVLPTGPEVEERSASDESTPPRATGRKPWAFLRERGGKVAELGLLRSKDLGQWQQSGRARCTLAVCAAVAVVVVGLLIAHAVHVEADQAKSMPWSGYHAAFGVATCGPPRCVGYKAQITYMFQYKNTDRYHLVYGRGDKTRQLHCMILPATVPRVIRPGACNHYNLTNAHKAVFMIYRVKLHGRWLTRWLRLDVFYDGHTRTYMGDGPIMGGPLVPPPSVAQWHAIPVKATATATAGISRA